MNGLPQRAAWLGGEVLLLTGEASDSPNGALASHVLAGGEALEVATEALALGANGNQPGGRMLVVNRFGQPVKGSCEGVVLTFGEGESAVQLDLATVAQGSTDAIDLLRAELAGRPAEDRVQALSFLWKAVAPSLDGPGAFPVAQVLAKIHEVLRPPLPQMFASPDDPTAAHVEAVIKCDSRGFWARGWLHDRDHTIKRLTLIAPEGGRADLFPGLFQFQRSDTAEVFGDKRGVRGEKHGFIRFAEIDGPSLLSKGWRMELETVFGTVVERAVPELTVDPAVGRETLLVNLREEPVGSDALIREHVHPAMSRIQDGLAAHTGIESVIQLGQPPAAPTVSVMVPLYSLLHFLEYQMTNWASDPHVAAQDLIYVLDTPEQAHDLEAQAHGLYSLYGIPFRVAIMKANSGYASANNCAAGLARARHLLLLNSDVVPDRPGWLEQMTAFYEATPDIGALGPKLLYEDDSLQHAGMYFSPVPQGDLWENLHFFKGQHRSLPAANIARQVPAVTGACMLVSRDLYEHAGGLSHGYVQGGYEDSDFCLRLADQGRAQWYMPGAELYHLEDQSYPKETRARVTRYNMWLQTELWRKGIERLMNQPQHQPPHARQGMQHGEKGR